MARRQDQDSAGKSGQVPFEPMQVKVRDVLGVLDQVLRGLAEVSEAYLLAQDIITAVRSGAAELEDESLLGPLTTLAEARAINRELIEEIRSQLGRGRDAGTA